MPEGGGAVVSPGKASSLLLWEGVACDSAPGAPAAEGLKLLGEGGELRVSG